MMYRWLQDLDQALRARGIIFQEYGDWRNCGRPASTGNFDPQGVLCHHTASPSGCSDADDISVIMAGNSEAPGPIAQLYVGRSGSVYILAAGRANHGGKGRRPGIDTGGCADMNAALLGIEAGGSGYDYWPDEQTYSYGEVVYALCDWYGWNVNADVYLHATTGPPSGGCNSKIDPSGPWQCEADLGGGQTWNLDVWRAWCVTMGGNAPSPQPGDDDMSLRIFQCSDADAAFIGPWYDSLQCADTVRWYTQTIKAQYDTLPNPVPVQEITVAQTKGMCLLGPIPSGDSQHEWSEMNFASVVQ